MIVYARTKEVLIKGKDYIGNEKYIQVAGEEQDSLKVNSLDSIELLKELTIELKKLNIYMSFISDEKLNDGDLPEID